MREMERERWKVSWLSIQYAIGLQNTHLHCPLLARAPPMTGPNEAENAHTLWEGSKRSEHANYVWDSHRKSPSNDTLERTSLTKWHEVSYYNF
jgi:hypothetical protein